MIMAKCNDSEENPGVSEPLHSATEQAVWLRSRPSPIEVQHNAGRLIARTNTLCMDIGVDASETPVEPHDLVVDVACLDLEFGIGVLDDREHLGAPEPKQLLRDGVADVGILHAFGDSRLEVHGTFSVVLLQVDGEPNRLTDRFAHLEHVVCPHDGIGDQLASQQDGRTDDDTNH